MKHEESRIQRDCIEWLDEEYPEFWVMVKCTKYQKGVKIIKDRRVSLCYAIPNGGLRAKREGSKMTGEGVRPGVWDLFISVPRGGYHGMYIEMKSAKGRISQEQKEFQKLAIAQGYKTVIIRSKKDFVTIVSAYLSGKMVAD